MSASDMDQAEQPAPVTKKRGRPPKAVPSPIKLTIHGVEVNYRQHIRELISRVVNSFDMATGDALADNFIKEISEGGTP